MCWFLKVKKRIDEWKMNIDAEYESVKIILEYGLCDPMAENNVTLLIQPTPIQWKLHMLQWKEGNTPLDLCRDKSKAVTHLLGNLRVRVKLLLS